MLLGALHVSGCGDDEGGTTTDGTTGGQQTSSSSGGTTGSTSSGGEGGEDGTTSASTGGDGGSGPAGTGGSEASTGGSDPGTGGTGGGEDPGEGGGGAAPESGLPTPPGADVAKPSGAPGGLKVIDWAGFAGAVTYSFDDVNQTQIQHFDEMMALNVPFTFYVWTGKQEANNAVWKRALTLGHELANHTRSHMSADNNGVDTDAATKDMKDKYDVTPYTMAAPNGADGYENIARTRFMINRGVSNALISPNDSTNPFKLPTYIPPQNASKAQMDAEVTSARTGKKWRTFCIHGFTGGSDGAYMPIPFQAWVDHVKGVKEFGDVWIGTMETIGAYWRGQKAISDATNTKNGNDTTYNWTLPQNFPPGKYVRVTVTGGTLKQGGVALKWHPKGYYEVALDAKSVTLSP